MKKYLLFLSSIVALSMAASAQQIALQPGDVQIKKISPAGVTTPQYSLSTGPMKRGKNLTWLEVEVDYATKVDYIDELTFEYAIVIGQQKLVGTTTYVDISKGMEHYAVVYVPPQAIQKILGTRPFTAASIGAIQVKVTRQGQELDTFPRNANIPNIQQMTGVVLNKPETPFAPLYWDRYEAIKPSAH